MLLKVEWDDILPSFLRSFAPGSGGDRGHRTVALTRAAWAFLGALQHGTVQHGSAPFHSK